MNRALTLSVCLLLGAAAGAGCHARPDDEAKTPVARTSTARTLGMFSTELSEDPTEQALLALEQDAWRREMRFRDAVDPGFSMSATRVGQAEIEAGLWSSDELFQLGAQLFHLGLRHEDGFGAADLPAVGRFHKGRRGGPDAHRCASCHWRGGPAGAGDGADSAFLDGDGDRQSSALARNPIALPGAGIVEILAREMTAELAARRAELATVAANQGSPARGEVSAKGVSFGWATVAADGTVDGSELDGIDADLVVKPFGHKGNVATLRDVVEDALLVHHGMQSDHLVKSAGPERVGAFGSPDRDGDGVIHEIEEGQVSALTLFVAMQEIPQIVLPDSSELTLMWATGQERFATLGCATCHVPSLSVASTRFDLASREGGATTSVDLAEEGAMPRIAPSVDDGRFRAWLFSDLKRHDIGPALAEARSDRGVAGNEFLTRPLWGLARSRPYLHDGRAPTIEDAILLHGGEAQKARDAYAALSEPERAPVRVFLTSLTRARRMVAQ
jgi:hypothetical protein